MRKYLSVYRVNRAIALISALGIVVNLLTSRDMSINSGLFFGLLVAINYEDQAEEKTQQKD